MTPPHYLGVGKRLRLGARLGVEHAERLEGDHGLHLVVRPEPVLPQQTAEPHLVKKKQGKEKVKEEEKEEVQWVMGNETREIDNAIIRHKQHRARIAEETTAETVR